MKRCLESVCEQEIDRWNWNPPSPDITRTARWKRAIRDALTAGKDLTAVTTADLAPVDEFHIGGRQATADLAAQLSLKPGAHLLDIRSGLGGASRYFAHEYRCRVTGIDLTEEYVPPRSGSPGSCGWTARSRIGTGAGLLCRIRQAISTPPICCMSA
jgi:hypothetical protein